MNPPAMNPYLPLTAYIPDGEPRVFDGRLYVYGSHDLAGGEKGFCPGDYEVWSAPVDDMTSWTCHGVSLAHSAVPGMTEGDAMAAPDVVRGPDGRYYLYFNTNAQKVCRVGVSEVPAGPFKLIGEVRLPDGTPYEGYKMFDPGVLVDDDGRVYLYVGFCIPVSERFSGRTSLFAPTSLGFELESDMMTIRRGPVPILPGAGMAAGTGFEHHAFYEASSIRKVGQRYYFIYSSELSHELCYATADRPDGPFSYGGTLVSNGDLGLSPTPVAFTGNNHGSVEQINGRWYVFYHRATNGSSWCRQGCLEPITILPDGRIPQVEITTSGPNGGPLPARGEYPAAIACNLFLTDAAGGESRPPLPRITQQAPDTDADQGRDTSFLENLTDRAVAGYKYFSCHGVTRMAVKTRAPEAEPIGSIPVFPGEEWHWQEASVSLPDGVHALYLRFDGQGAVSLAAIRFAADNAVQ